MKYHIEKNTVQETLEKNAKSTMQQFGFLEVAMRQTSSIIF